MYCHNALGNKSPLLFLCKINQKLFHSAQYFFFVMWCDVKYVVVLHMCKILIWSASIMETPGVRKKFTLLIGYAKKAESTLDF